ncbi:MAG: Smr/MutS family protein [Ascidiaceihabitans sp.]|nr:Smr/MutS family protein [Ascidiaceihabitans sp.]
MSRKLRPDEIELWKQVAAQTERLEMGTRPAALDIEPQFVPAPKRRKMIDTLSVPHGKLGAKPAKPTARAHLIPAIADQVRAATVQMDRKSFDQMKRGKLKPEGRIDLHGMTLDRAHPALMQFILSAQANGKRLVLVITGKGKARDDGGPIPVRFGVLRHQVPQWMSMPPLSSAILQVTQAHLKHGGGGAYYVYLRKPR